MLDEPRTKQEVVDTICDLFDAPPLTVGPGSTEPKAVFTLVVERLGLPVETHLDKPHLGQAIAEAAGLTWDSDCDSRATPSGGGSTVTRTGLIRVLEAATVLLDRDPEYSREPSPSGSTGPLTAAEAGAGYRTASGGIDAALLELIQDWEALDRSTRTHAETQNTVADWLRTRGATPISPSSSQPQFDVGWWDGDLLTMCEVKSVVEANRRQQVRLGLGQILEYRFAAQQAGVRARGILVLSEDPTDFEIRLCESVGVDCLGPRHLH